MLTASLVNLIFSPAIGQCIDAIPKKKVLIICGHLGIAVSGVIPLAGSLFLPIASRFFVLIATVVFATVAGIFAGAAMDYFMKAYVPEAERMQKLASLNIVAQIALIAGTGFAGVIISLLSFDHAFLAISFCGLLAALAGARFLPNLTVVDRTSAARRKGAFSVGPLMYFKYPSLFSVACCAALVFSIGQITNTLLPGLINIYFQRTSISYSLVEAAWAIGAFCVSAFLVGKINNFFGRNAQDLLLIAGMAGMLAIVPYLKDFAILLAAHLLLGAGFAFVRIRSETRFLASCPMPLLGRFRANGLCLANLIGLMVFSARIVFHELSVPGLYLLLAGG
ncbi:MAG: hypothetical protein JWP38_1889 [Herbaspirillum sp.]|nr:hypothetical protein [Herbaspirillum sp.]